MALATGIVQSMSNDEGQVDHVQTWDTGGTIVSAAELLLDISQAAPRGAWLTSPHGIRIDNT